MSKSNQEWVKLLSEEFEVSNSVARKMLHIIYEIKRRSKHKTNSI